MLRPLPKTKNSSNNGSPSTFIGSTPVPNNNSPESNAISSAFSTAKDIVAKASDKASAAMAVKPTPLSGELGDRYGLVDFTNEYPTYNCPRLVMAKEPKEKLDRAVARINALPKEEKAKLFPGWEDKEWRPSISETYRTTAEQNRLFQKYGSPKAARPGSSGHEGGADVDIHANDKTRFPTKEGWVYFKKCMQAEGFSRLNDTYENHHFQYRPKGMEHASNWISYQNRPGGDAEKIDQNAIKDRQARKQFGSTVNSNKKGAIVGREEYGPNPAGVNYSSMSTGEAYMLGPSSMRDSLDYAILNSPTARLEVLDLPAQEIPDEIKYGKYTNLPEKIDKNVVSNKCPVGFESKIGTPAQIKIALDPNIDPNTSEEELATFKAFEDAGVNYIDCFVLQSVRYTQEEKYFVFQALNGETVTFFFGGKPVVYSFSGSVYDTDNQQWLNDFEFYYQTYLRGSRSLLNKTRIFIIYSDQILEGFMLDVNVQKDANMNDGASFSFNFILVQKTVIGGYENPVQRSALANRDSILQNTDASLVQHKEQLLSGNTGVTLNSAQDFWKQSSTQMLSSPPLNVPEIIKQTDPLQGYTRESEQTGKSGMELLDSVTTCFKTPGATRAVDGASLKEMKDVSNPVDRTKYLVWVDRAKRAGTV